MQSAQHFRSWHGTQLLYGWSGIMKSGASIAKRSVAQACALFTARKARLPAHVATPEAHPLSRLCFVSPKATIIEKQMSGFFPFFFFHSLDTVFPLCGFYTCVCCCAASLTLPVYRVQPPFLPGFLYDMTGTEDDNFRSRCPRSFRPFISLFSTRLPSTRSHFFFFLLLAHPWTTSRCHMFFFLTR